MVKTIVQGAVGLTQVALGIDRATNAQIAARLAACLACPHRIFGKPDKLSNFSRCRLCNCLVRQAAKLAGKRCPDGRWEAESKAGANGDLNER